MKQQQELLKYRYDISQKFKNNLGCAFLWFLASCTLSCKQHSLVILMSLLQAVLQSALLHPTAQEFSLLQAQDLIIKLLGC